MTRSTRRYVRAANRHAQLPSRRGNAGPRCPIGASTAIGRCPSSLSTSDSKLHPPVARPGSCRGRTWSSDWSPRARRRSSRSSPRRATGRRPCWRNGRNARRRRVGWVSADAHDNDPAVLLTYIAVALHRIEANRPGGVPIDSPRRVPASRAPRRLVSAMAAMQRPVALVLDHLEAVTNQESLDAVAALALGLPAGSQLAIGSRDALPLPAARLRAQGGIVEIGVDDLAMSGPRGGFVADGGRSRAPRGGRG